VSRRAAELAEERRKGGKEERRKEGKKERRKEGKKERRKVSARESLADASCLLSGCKTPIGTAKGR